MKNRYRYHQPANMPVQSSKKKIIIIASIAAAAAAAAFFIIFMLAVWTIGGIDISHYQENVSWKALAQSGDVKFVYIKATEGSTNQDPNFQEYWNGALQNGITPGAYHFYTSTSSAQDQAANFIATVPKVKGALPPALDIEGSIIDETGVKSEIDTFIKAITSHYGVKPVFYVPYTVYNVIYDEYSDYDFWIIDDQSQPLVKGWTFRQYTETGKIAGVDGKVDLDEYKGTLWNFEQLKQK